ncbi:MAG: hypothetical protein V4631_20860 [Pseudomonadota bacterium]
MNRGTLNGLGINGGAPTPSWVKLALAAATAAALFVSATGVRTAYGASSSSGTAVATVAGSQTFYAHVSGSCGANYALFPTLEFAGRSSAIGTATGLAAVLRLVHGEATADGTATGLAIPSSKLGESSETAESSVVECLAHLIRPGRSVDTAEAMGGGADGLATRYCVSLANAVATGRADQTVQLSGEAFQRHDGYVVDATGTSTAFVDNGYTAIIAGFGSLAVSSADSAAHAFVRHPGGALGTTTVTASGFANRTARAAATATASATVTAEATRIKNGASSSTASVTQGLLIGLMRYRALSTASAIGSMVAAGVRTAYGAATNSANAAATAQHADFYSVAATGTASASASDVAALAVYAGAASGAATATSAATPADQHYAESDATGAASSVFAFATAKYKGHVLGLATATGHAEGFANSDVLAPDERHMTIEADERVMTIQFEDRLLLAA